MENSFLNERIISLLKQHPEGGEKFFDSLDFMLRSDTNIIEVFTDFVFCMMRKLNIETNEVSIILTGQFGRVLVNIARDFLGYFGDFLLVNGDIRKGAKVLIDKLPQYHDIIFLDDSIYSGTTRDKILDSLNSFISTEPYKLIQTFVIYDGSKDLTNIKSMFRYYDK